MSDRCEAVHVVVPDGIDDPARPSGGNTYDRRLCSELRGRGWSVHEHAVAGFWTRPSAASIAALGGVLERIPDDGLVLVDGLIASCASAVLVPLARRLRLVVLMHMPLGHRAPLDTAQDVRRQEHASLAAAAAVLTTSDWARRTLIALYELPEHRVHVAEPGVDPAELAHGTADGGALICVAAVTRDKGHDVLLSALESIAELTWDCLCVGRLDRDPELVERLRRRALRDGLRGRVSFLGPRTGTDLDAVYAGADVLVHPSRAETYGMVVTEALARGLPVIATEVGGVPEAVGHGGDGIRPALLIPPEDPTMLSAALRDWLGDAELRARLRHAARERRTSVARWSTTGSVVARVLSEVSR